MKKKTITSEHLKICIWLMKEKKGLAYLGMVAHECNIFAVSRQLVIISLFFSLCWKRENRQHCIYLDGCVLFDITWCVFLTQKMHVRRMTYKLVCAQELWWLFCDHVVQEDWALGLGQILMICGGRWGKWMEAILNWDKHANQSTNQLNSNTL